MSQPLFKWCKSISECNTILKCAISGKSMPANPHFPKNFFSIISKDNTETF